MSEAGFWTGGFNQCNWHEGLSYRKPTRLITDVAPLRRYWYEGWPSITEDGVYEGPVPRECGHVHTPLVQRRNNPSGAFATSGTGAYPWGMCLRIAQGILDAFFAAYQHDPMLGEGDQRGTDQTGEPPPLTDAPASHGGDPFNDGCEERAPTEDEDSEGEAIPKAGAGWWGRGPPMMVYRGMHKPSRPLEDGAGICSPG
jgi:hypothetical protein